MNKPSIYSFTREQLRSWLTEQGHKPSRASRIWEYLYLDRVSSFAEMEEVLPEVVRLLEEHLVLQPLAEHIAQEAQDGTVKFLFRLPDGNLIETVLMRQKFGLTVCVTTQVGCNIGCSFCASGLLAKSRDLDSGEITGQIMMVQRYLDSKGQGERVTHIVVMGIGEPFDNYGNLMNFLATVMNRKGLSIGPKHITVSTSGLADKIREFADADLRVNLAISLHAPNNELRSRIMKINRGIPLERLMEAIDYFIQRTNQRVALEYILLRDVNDHTEEAAELAELIGDRKRHISVNLIPYNPVDEHGQYQRSAKESVLDFFDILKKSGINTTIRVEHGADIDAACGQLRSKQMRNAQG
ncbi:23S rRNA (adenine(2503)-C(2))-methyltransferase RlmN [Gorillibacterium sp. sgz5001074]|uniref:23S rRNA (adenine(2503)-C(2))-methyltransferase RlmN n=1 Tax=Gorillibacterium sp. sgz5001074 TaxID=3446695 RepID=UPI003F669DEF